MSRALLAPLLALCLALAACTGIRLAPPPPAPIEGLATIRGMPEGVAIRFWGDEVPADVEGQLGLIRKQIAARAAKEGALPNGGRFDVLALSGGGSDGAYGAGLLDGWSDHGDRPEFGLVTGISVGALIAPFAFLGEDYDDELERLFTNTSTEDVVEFAIFRAVFGWALGVADVEPLERTLDRMLTPEMVRRIAEEHLKGRRLWIGTTYLDAQRPVIWDIGAIAASAYTDKRELIKDVLLASTAIPGAFPPVLFPVELDGRSYLEMHVDGSVTRQIFVYPDSLDLTEEVNGAVPGMKRGTIYLVRNTKLAPDFQPVSPSVLAIVERAIFTLTKAAGLGDVEIIEQQAREHGWGLQRASVPLAFDYPQESFFDPDYMSALYEIGYDRAFEGIAWEAVIEPGGAPAPAATPPEPETVSGAPEPETAAAAPAG